MKKNKGLHWPIGLAIAIMCVISMGAWTIVETAKEPVEESNLYMRNYQDADAKANDIINDRIAFNKQYDMQYISKQLNVNDAEIVYKITTKDGKPVNDANLSIIVTRPQVHSQDVTLNNPKINDGIYKFNTKLPGIGRWDILASVEIGSLKRYYNLKVDTRFDLKPVVY
ncbi:MAG: FixH family protein [Thiovulaceae bacterium]|nr:FixH family protein [Sulfurimonadaceae bacterium]